MVEIGVYSTDGAKQGRRLDAVSDPDAMPSV